MSIPINKKLFYNELTDLWNSGVSKEAGSSYNYPSLFMHSSKVTLPILDTVKLGGTVEDLEDLLSKKTYIRPVSVKEVDTSPKKIDIQNKLSAIHSLIQDRIDSELEGDISLPVLVPTPYVGTSFDFTEPEFIEEYNEFDSADSALRSALQMLSGISNRMSNIQSYPLTASALRLSPLRDSEGSGYYPGDTFRLSKSGGDGTYSVDIPAVISRVVGDIYRVNSKVPQTVSVSISDSSNRQVNVSITISSPSNSTSENGSGENV